MCALVVLYSWPCTWFLCFLGQGSQVVSHPGLVVIKLVVDGRENSPYPAPWFLIGVNEGSFYIDILW